MFWVEMWVFGAIWQVSRLLGFVYCYKGFINWVFSYVLKEGGNVCHHSCSDKLFTPEETGPNIDIQPSDAD